MESLFARKRNDVAPAIRKRGSLDSTFPSLSSFQAANSSLSHSRLGDLCTLLDGTFVHPRAVRQRKRYLAVSLSQRASGPMARYFFHIREDDQIEEDPRRYRSAEHRGRPRRAAREIVAELVVQGEQIGKKRFEIVDEMGISSRFTRSPQW